MLLQPCIQPGTSLYLPALDAASRTATSEYNDAKCAFTFPGTRSYVVPVAASCPKLLLCITDRAAEAEEAVPECQ